MENEELLKKIIQECLNNPVTEATESTAPSDELLEIEIPVLEDEQEHITESLGAKPIEENKA